MQNERPDPIFPPKFSKYYGLARWLACLTVLLFNSSILYAGTPRIYQNQGLEIIKKIDFILIKHKICMDSNECTKNRFHFFLPTASGVVITTYQIEDKEIIEQIIDACIDTYFENDLKLNISLEMFHESHEQTRGTVKQFFYKPFVSFHIERKVI